MQTSLSLAFVATILILLTLIVAGIISSFLSYKYARLWLDFPVERWEYQDWVVVSDASECAVVAKNTFLAGGYIGDAAVAALFCMAVLLPHRSGLGGGLMALYYNHSTGKVEALDALGWSPLNTVEPMFAENETLASLGRKASIVPGAVAGFAALHRRLGRLPWKVLITPAINYAKKGFAVSTQLAAALLRNERRLNLEPKLRHRFWNYPANRLMHPNEALQQPLLAELLEEMAKYRERRYFYRSHIGEEIAADLQREGGVMTPEDIIYYMARWVTPIEHYFGTRTLYTVPVPGAGALLGTLASTYTLTDPVLTAKKQIQVPVFDSDELHRLVELLKFTISRVGNLGDSKRGGGFQDRATHLIATAFERNFTEGSPLKGYASYNATYNFNEDYGGAYLAVRDKQGNALSIVTSLNSEFGSMYETSSGIIMNNFMDLFSRSGGKWGLKQSKSNKLMRLKRPQTSIIPTIITDGLNNHFFAALGTTGGLESISAMGQLLSCLTKFPLFSCVRNNVRVRVVPEQNGFSVMTGPASGDYDPGKLLHGKGHKIVKGVLTSTVSGIMSTDRGTWVGVADVSTTNGGSAGEHYVHPILRNPRVETHSRGLGVS